jgi:hypothetical protein
MSTTLQRVIEAAIMNKAIETIADLMLFLSFLFFVCHLKLDWQFVDGVKSIQDAESVLNSSRSRCVWRSALNVVSSMEILSSGLIVAGFEARWVKGSAANV